MHITDIMNTKVIEPMNLFIQTQLQGRTKMERGRRRRRGREEERKRGREKILMMKN
jgi:hypothetical protein